tara:strand:- start:188345 stop:190339 length:1995 start_codon:yes stop_codon:yes gene_type:complete
LERVIILLLLGLTVLGLTSFSAKASSEFDLFEEFTEDFQDKVDIEIDSLDFVRPENGIGNSGTFKFRKFHVQNPKFSIFVGNENSLFDSNIFIKGSLVGIKGPQTRFAYDLDEINADYLHSFKYAKVRNTKLLMDKEGINFSGEYYKIRKPESILELQNFIWNCDRNSEHLFNDSVGFLSGCLNSAEIIPHNEETPIKVSFNFLGKEESPSDRVDFESDIRLVNFTDDRVQGKASISNITFGSGVHLVTSNVKVDCFKEKNLIDINTETMLIPCLNDLKLESDLFGIYFKDTDKEFYNFEAPRFQITDREIKLENKMFKFVGENSKVVIRDVKMAAQKFEDFDPLVFDSFLKSLYNKNKFTPSIGKNVASLDFSFTDPEARSDQTKEIRIETRVKEFSTSQTKILVDTDVTKLSMDDDYDFYMNKVQIECEKESNIIEFEGSKFLADCKHSGRYLFRDIVIDNKKDIKKPKYFIKPEYLKVEDGYMSILAPGFQLVDEKENITLLNSSVKCLKRYEKDLFNILDVLEGCLKESKIYISRIVSEKNKKRDATKGIYELYKEIIHGKVFNPISLVNSKDAFVRDVKVQINNNWMKLDLDIKFLKADLKVKAEGRISLDRETEELVIDIKQAKLPLSKSKKILMYFLKKNLANDTITFENGLIRIKL